MNFISMLLCGIVAFSVLNLVPAAQTDFGNYYWTNVTLDPGVVGGRVKEITLPDDTQHNVSVFLGIPYAKPPVGDLRFSKPVKLPSLGPYFSADTESKACPQNPFILKVWVPGPSDMNEDCLKLNVYVPGNLNFKSHLHEEINPESSDHTHGPKAVMIWFHGGAFLIGQSRIYNAERLAAVGDVIVVTANYRLGPLGFLTTGDSVVSGNAALWDQHEVIWWVHEHISAFGGDPERVTLFGESAGAASALLQAMHRGNKGKIHRVIASSGSPLCPWGFRETPATTYAIRLAQKLGCGFDQYPVNSVERHRRIVECLRTKSFQEIINGSSVGSQPETLFRPEWVPVVDNEFIKVSPKTMFWWPGAGPESSHQSPDEADSLLADVDALIGTNYNDGEVIATISVQAFIKSATGKDFNSDNLSIDAVSSVYVPKILRDHFNQLGAKNMQGLTKAIQEVYLNGNSSDSSSSIDHTQRAQALQYILDVTTDYEVLMPALQSISNMAARSIKSSAGPVSSQKPTRYLWQFDRKYPYVNRPGWLHHAAHGDDPYVFGFPQSMEEAFHITRTIEVQEWSLAKSMIMYWTNFAKTGNPNTPAPTTVIWPEFDLQTMNYLYISANMTASNARQNLFTERVKMWSQTLPDILKKHSSGNGGDSQTVGFGWTLMTILAYKLIL